MVELSRIDEHIVPYRWVENGRKPEDRKSLALSFIAKAIWKLPKSWIGYKLHLDVADGDIPVSAMITSASVHDSQVAVPLIQMSSDRVTYLYDLADSAYDAPHIKGYSRLLGVNACEKVYKNGQMAALSPTSSIILL